MNEIDKKQEYYYPQVFSKSNYLIQARFDYTLLCNQTLAVSLQKAVKEGDEYVARFSVKEVKDLLQKNYKDFYNQMKKAADKMSSTRICIEDPQKGKFEFHQLIPTFVYDNGNCEVHFNSQLNHIVGNLTTNFTSFNLTTLTHLDTLPGYRLYETIKSDCYYPKFYKGEKTGKYTIKYSVSELKVMLNAVDINHPEIASLLKDRENINYDLIIEKAQELYEKDKDKDIPTKDKYRAPKWQQYRDFKRQVIVPAIEEINKKTELEIELGENGKRNIKEIVFYVTDTSFASNIKTDDIIVEEKEFDEDDFIDEIHSVLLFNKEPFKIKELRTIAKEADFDKETILKAYEVVNQMGTIENPVGAMIAAIKNKWEVSTPATGNKKSDFSHFEQRGYDYDQMAKELL